MVGAETTSSLRWMTGERSNVQFQARFIFQIAFETVQQPIACAVLRGSELRISTVLAPFAIFWVVQTALRLGHRGPGCVDSDPITLG
ncbi:hypothetical protein AQZ49_18930 [Novosphingobium sp. FSW06-99]|nr:hypothetical protein AQZ49_18930 [Novosphingobium sp. FSW06-99]